MQANKFLIRVLLVAMPCLVMVNAASAFSHLFITDNNQDVELEKWHFFWHSPPSLANFPGAWEQVGTGRVFHIDQGGVRLYSATKATCSLQDQYDGFAQADAQWVKLRGKAYRGHFSVIPAGGTEKLRFKFQRLKKLPAVCNKAADVQPFDPEFLFEHTWHLFNDYYPFFELYQLDWQQQYRQYRPQVSATTNQVELFNILAQMISPLDDGHVDLLYEGQTDSDVLEYSSAMLSAWTRYYVATGQAGGEEIDDVALATVQSFNKKLYQQYGDKFTSSDLTTWGGTGEGLPPLVWGVLEGNVGYLQINTMGGNLVPENEMELVSEKRERRRMNRMMRRVLEDLDDTDSMIVDVRFNGGGYDSVALAIANHFADKKRLAFTKQKYQTVTAGELYWPRKPRLNRPQRHYLNPKWRGTYTKPVSLITGPDTASAAEVFTLAMRTLPHVQHFGEATQGVLSDVLSVNLQQNWWANLSHEIYLDSSGKLYEGHGIPPQEKIASSSVKAFSYYLFPAVDSILTKMGAIAPLSQAEFDAQVSALMSDGSIPSFSVAWVNQHGQSAANAYGYADIENVIPATVDTPYKIGSISKTLIGISLAQMLEQGLVTLDEPIGRWLPFRLDHPQQDSHAMTFRQLATHTAGINDSGAYFCGYYIDETHHSLAVLLGINCPSPVDTQQVDFLKSYLHRDGRLYSAEDNFIDAEIGETCRYRYHYSNVGAALTAEVLTQAAGRDFAQWTQEAILNPLGMVNTHWFSEQYLNKPLQPAVRYLLNENFAPTRLPEHSLATWADGDLRTSVNDLSNLLLSIMAPEKSGVGRILSDQATKTMLSAQTSQLSPSGEQGLFWTNDHFMIGHDGGDPGVVANMQYIPSLDIGFVFMMNVSGFDDETDAWIAAKYAALQKLIYQRGIGIKSGF